MDLASIFQPIEGVLGSVGLSSPSKRFMFFTSLASGLEYYIKPSYAYKPDGTMRKPMFLSSESDATYTPPFLFPSIAGAVFSLYL